VDGERQGSPDGEIAGAHRCASSPDIERFATK
jgi:hypothetical protein